MTPRYRWSWLALAALVAASLLWTHRHEYAACDLDGCLRIHRWSGIITFEPADGGEPPPAADAVIVRRARPAPHQRTPRLTAATAGGARQARAGGSTAGRKPRRRPPAGPAPTGAR